VSQFNVQPLYEGVYISSVSVDINPNSFTADGVFGAAYAALVGAIPPSAYLTFWSSATQWKTNGTAYGSVNTTDAAAFMGKAFIQLDEVTPANIVVQTISLGNLLYTLTNAVTGDANLKGSTFTATQGMMTVKITFLASAVVGVLNVPGNAIITPKTLESVLEIDNFPYMNTANSVRLTMLVGSAAGFINVQASFTHYASGNGDNGAFFTLSHVAQTDGTATPVTISAFTDVKDAVTYGNAYIDTQVRATYGAAASFKLVNVTFKAGSKIILFDPAVGVGANPPSSGSGKLTFPLLAIFIAFVKIFLL